VQSYPNNAAAAYYYALSLRKQTVTPSVANDHAAEPYLLRAVELKPDFSNAHYELGLLYQDLGREKKAVEQFEIAVKQRPAFLQAHYHLARLYKKTGRTDSARREFSLVEALKASAP
jgi:Tfp pilus assembly protein PilF